MAAKLDCSEAMTWVIDYEEQFPFHAFAPREYILPIDARQRPPLPYHAN